GGLVRVQAPPGGPGGGGAEPAAPSSMLRELRGRNPAELTAEDVGEAFRAGDPLAREVLEQTADLLTVWLGNVVDLLEPDVIVIGGGAGELIGEFFDRIRERLPSWSINQRCGESPLVKARYAADAGIGGAAALCRGQ